MASAFFLKFEKPSPPGTEINGSSQEAHHARWVVIDSFSFGATSQRAVGPVAGKSDGDGAARIRELAMSTGDGASFMKLMVACANGTTYETVTLEVVQNDQVVMRITMKGATITSCATGGSHGDPTPLMSFALNFDKVDFKYLAASTATQKPPTGAPPPPANRKY